jgi:hypothetical protein
LCSELIPLWKITVGIAHVSYIHHHIDILQVLNQLVSCVYWTTLEVIVLIWAINLSLIKELSAEFKGQAENGSHQFPVWMILLYLRKVEGNQCSYFNFLLLVTLTRDGKTNEWNCFCGA